MNRIGFWDLLIIAIFLLAVTVQGLLVSKRQKSLRDYFVAGGTMPWWAVSVSLYGSLLTPMTFIGITGWVFQKDSRWFIGNSVVGIFAILFATRIWVPLWHRLRPLSIYEYLEQRFNLALRICGSAIFLIQMIFWLGNELVTTAGAFAHVTGISGLHCLLVIVSISTLYTILGGSRADIWTDVTQFAVLFVAFISIGILLLMYFRWHAGRIYEIASLTHSAMTGEASTRMISFETNLGIEGSIFAIIVHRINSVLAFGTEQVTVQRLLSTGKKEYMRRALLGFATLDAVVTTLVVAISWAFVAFYRTNPLAHVPVLPDQVLVDYAANFAPVIVRGLVMAGLASALMGSYGAGLNSVSNVIINDCYRRLLKGNGSQSHYLFASKLVTFGMALLVLIFACWQYGHREVTAIQRTAQLTVLVAAPVACIFMLGVFSRHGNVPGALAAGGVSIVFSLIFNGFPGLFAPLIAGVSWVWVGPLGTIVGLGSGWLISMVFRPPGRGKIEGLTLSSP